MQDHEAATGKALSLHDPIIPEVKFSPNLLLSLIAQIYCGKIASDRVRERQDNEPLDFPPPATGMHHNIHACRPTLHTKAFPDHVNRRTHRGGQEVPMKCL